MRRQSSEKVRGVRGKCGKRGEVRGQGGGMKERLLDVKDGRE